MHNLSDGPYQFGSSKGIYSNRFTLLFEAQPVLSVPDLQRSIALFPNPTQGSFRIHSANSAIEQITVYDVVGRTVLSQKVNQLLQAEVQLQDVHQAIYLVQIKTTDGMVTKQLVKN